jgi:hypothetical protein
VGGIVGSGGGGDLILLPTKAGESRLVVDGDGRRIAAATAATATTTIFTTVTTTVTASASTSTTELATEFASFTTVGTVATVATEIATLGAITTAASTTELATTATAAGGITALLLEAVVDVEELLLGGTLAFASGLLFALEVVGAVLLGQLLGRLPFLVVLASLIGRASFLETESLQLLGSLLGQILGVRLGGVLRFGLRLGDGLTALGDGDWFATVVECGVLRTGVPSGRFLLFFGDGLTSLLVSPFALSSLLTPGVLSLLGMVTRDR